jgi:hypothetical protein
MATSHATGTRLVTPLVVISLFVTLTEIAMSFAATRTTGSIQWMFAAFAVVFAVAVAGAFFYTLWRQPWVLYHPGEYGQQDVVRYVEAMRQRRIEDVNVDSKIQHSLRTVFTDEVVAALKTLPAATNQEKVRSVVEKATERAVADIRKSSFLTFDLQPIMGDGAEPWIVPFDRFAAVSDMLDDLWFRLDYRVPPHTYNKKWALRDVASGEWLRNMGRAYAEVALGTANDDRPLGAVGIKPGMTLQAAMLQ